MTSHHCLDRAKERLGLNHKYAASIIERGIQRGQTSSSFRSGSEKDWLEKRSRCGFQALAYNGMCIIVSSDGNCVTVYKLPTWFGKKVRFDHRNKRIRNCARYQKMCYIA